MTSPESIKDYFAIVFVVIFYGSIIYTYLKGNN